MALLELSSLRMGDFLHSEQVLWVLPDKNPCAVPKSAAATNTTFLDENIPLVSIPETRGALRMSRKSPQVWAQCPNPHVSLVSALLIDVLRRYLITHNSHMYRAPRGKGPGRIHFCPAGLPSRRFNQRTYASTYASRTRATETEPSPGEMRDLPRLYSISTRCTAGEWKRTAIVAARVRVDWFPFGWGSVSTHTHGLHLQLHRPPWACEAAGCDANGTGWFAHDISSLISVVAAGAGPIHRIGYYRNINAMVGDG